MKKRYRILISEALLWCLLVFLDQLSKAWCVEALKGKPPIVLIKGVLELYYLENRGAAFSLLQNAQGFFFVIAAAAILFIAFALWKMPAKRRYAPLHVLLTLISAGAMGNLTDRISLGYVRDFIYFSLIDFPVFNVADIYVTVSTIVLVVLILFVYKEEDFKFLKKNR